MSTQDVSFHVRHEVFPDRVLSILQAIANGESSDEIVQVERHYKRMRDLGLIDDDRSSTPLGNAILNITDRKPNLWADLGHYLHYTLWDEFRPYLYGFSWFYRAFCDYLFEQDDFRFGKSEFTSSVCIAFNAQIESEEIFQPYLTGNPSLSTDSIAGIQHWLDALTPPVIEKNVFSQRSFCAPELLLLAVGWVFRDEPDPLGVPLLLSRPRRERICRLCLLDPQYFERALDWLLPRFPKFITSEDKAGFYGRSIRLRQMPRVEDFAS